MSVQKVPENTSNFKSNNYHSYTLGVFVAISNTLIDCVFAREIIDSRGNPTVETEITLNKGIKGRAAVPSGASTGEREAIELRDSAAPKAQLGDESLRKRFLGKGVLAAVNKVNAIIAENIVGMNVTDQVALDSALIALDGTENKSKLGANAILSVSMAAANAAAKSLEMPLLKYLGGSNAKILPVPMMNILNGGAHSDAPIDIQEFMIMPHNAPTIREAIRMGAEIFHALKKILKNMGLSSAVGDEGGFAPEVSSNEHALEIIVQAIESAGYEPGHDISIALDAAASEFYDEKTDSYVFKKSDKSQHSSAQMIAFYERLIGKFPIVSIEDGLSQNDWAGWAKFT
jgi:enolase